MVKMIFWQKGQETDENVEYVRLWYLLGYSVDESVDINKRRKAVEEYLVPSIETVIGRVYSILPSRVPHFDDFCYGTQPG